MVSHYPAKFATHRHCGSGDMFLVFHVNLQDHFIIDLWDFTDGSSSW